MRVLSFARYGKLRVGGRLGVWSKAIVENITTNG